MYYYRKILFLCLVLIFLSSSNVQSEMATSRSALIIGVTPGPQAEIMAFVQNLAQQEGLKLELVEYKDYVQPNLDLHRGKLWANSLQHLPYLENTLAKEPKFQLVPVFKTISYPLALYPGQRHELLEQLKSKSSTQQKQDTKNPTSIKAPGPQEQLSADSYHAQHKNQLLIGLPNDPTNLSRALQLLAAAHYLDLKQRSHSLYTLSDVIVPDNQILLLPMDAALLPKLLKELDLAVISCNYALVNGLKPAQDAVFMEAINNPYVNLFVTTRENINDPRLQKIEKLYRSKSTKDFIFEKYQGAILPSW